MKISISIVILELLITGHLLSCKSDIKIIGATKEGTDHRDANRDLPKAAPDEELPVDPHTDSTVLNSETVSVPSVINGAFLVCAMQEANDTVELRVGCGFQDANNHRVEIRSLAASARFYLLGSQPNGVNVASLPGDANYDAIFSFTGSTFDLLKSAAFATFYQVELIGPSNGGPDKVVGGQGTSVAMPPAARWIREISSDANANQLCDGNEICIYQGNGLMWYKDLGAAKTYGDANSFCDTFTDSFSDWRLPTEGELKMAFQKGIVEVAAAPILNILNEGYFALDSKGGTGVNPITGASIQFPDGEAHRSVCVRTTTVP